MSGADKKAKPASIAALAIEDARVRIELELPWVLAAIAKRVKGAIEQRSRVLLEKK